jgi:FkbM family methyltransferase
MILEAKTVARSLSRRVGLTPTLNRIRAVWHRAEYEDKFAAALLKSVRPSDCVWDIGANVGFYTEQLSRLARLVVAIEPIAENLQRIKARKLPNVEYKQVALGDQQSQKSMSTAGAYSSLVSSPYVPSDTSREPVTIMPGDLLLDLAPPDVVKIDVEGFEPEVVRGMPKILRSVRAAFIEVHFAILEHRGLLHAPSEVVSDLKNLGFTTIKWVDASHLMATRDV